MGVKGMASVEERRRRRRVWSFVWRLGLELLYLGW
jgi:hypothetical protein